MPRLDEQRRFQLFPGDLYRFFLFMGLLLVGVLNLPNAIVDVASFRLVWALAVLGIWRYAWWFTHLVRSWIYARWVFPRLREQANRIWEEGWRPKRVVVMLTTFKERRETTELVLAALTRECRSTGIPMWVFLGTGDRSDEVVAEQFLRRAARDLDFHLVFVRQNVSGKRAAIGLTLRAMSRHGVSPDDLVLFEDGDTYVEPGMLRKCLPLFQLLPRLDAVTTDEKAVVHGPGWMQDWIDMRFAQRHLAMQSQSLSGKVLTLTGRLSILRARDVLSERFIRMVESDYLDDWLWGRYRFLSGDDKSTVYALLSKPGGATMLYVPDALTCTIEHVEGSGLERTRQNLLRWSGNLLRNGRRCIALGPRRIGLFIWWCYVDQQVAMWTTLVGPVAAISTSAVVGPVVLLGVVLWILASRTLLAAVLFTYHGRINLRFPLLLYFNQLLNSCVKVFILFRLAQQRWANRGDQRSQLAGGRLHRFQTAMATFLMWFYVALFVLGLCFYFQVMEPLNLRLLTGVLFARP